MTDFQGVKLHKGVVAFMAPEYRQLVRGKIDAFASMKVRIKFKMTTASIRRFSASTQSR